AVQGSTNGTSFTNLVGSTGYPFSPSANTVTVPLTASTRYVRVNITGNTGWPAAQLSEFELYGPDSGDTQAPSAPGSLVLTEPGANADVTSVAVKLNPDPVWGPRTQNFQVLGRDQGATNYTELVARADYSFNPSTNQNTVTIPVTARTADVRLQFYANSGAPG